MCGIVGIVGEDNPPLKPLNRLMEHRGPDDEGYYYDPGSRVAFAMRRLSILDLEHGHQPMGNHDGSLWIVHNGEIFNAPTLRDDLERKGYRFASRNSDTEVLLRLYEEKQENMVQDLNGMFAFVIHDKKRNVLFGARDRIGIKPLYYTRRPRKFAFASEIKCFLGLPWFSPEVNKESLFHYVSLRFVPGSSSIFREVHRIPPAHWFVYDLKTDALQIHSYWRIRYQEQEERSIEEWQELIRHELRAAVHRWVLSDVPVGCSLSGGLDSSAIVGLLAESGYGPIRTYSLGFAGEQEQEWNELHLAKKVAERWGTEHHELILNEEDLLSDIIKMVWYLDEPYGGGLPSWYVFQFMRQHVTVGLTGTGGDELFGDYGRYIRYERYAAEESNGGGAKEAMAPLMGFLLGKIPDAWIGRRRKMEWLHYPELIRDPFRWCYFNTYYYFQDRTKREAVFEMKTGAILDTSEYLKTYLQKAGAMSHRDAINSVGMMTQLPDEFLLMTDRFSMAHSLEARVPFLDHRLVEAVFRIPGFIRSRPDNLKYLLKRAVADLIPDEVHKGKKRGFTLPTALWLRGKLRPLVKRFLSPQYLKSQGYFRPELYDLYVKSHLNGDADNHPQIWTLLMFQLWHLIFIKERMTGKPTFSWKDLC